MARLQSEKWCARIFGLSLGVFATFSAFPQQGDALLWRIEGSGKPSFLFGTIHLGDDRVTALKPIVAQALDVSDSLFTEIPLDQTNLFEQASRVLLPEDESLAGLIGDELVQRIDDYLKSINPALSILPFERLKVWALATTLTLVERQFKNPGKLPLDVLLYQNARLAGKRVGGLETLDEQLSIFEAMTLEVQTKLLTDTLDLLERDKARGEDFAERFIQLYEAGDLRGLGEVMTEYVKQDELYDDLLDSLLYRRNEIMAERILEQLEFSPDIHHFFAVGAGHLWGDRSILEQLEFQGLKLTRLR